VATILGWSAAVAAALGVISGGVLSDWWRKHDPRGRLFVSMLAAVGPIPIVYVMFTTPSLTTFYWLNPFAHYFGALWVGVTAAAVFALAASQQRAEAISLASPGTAPAAKYATDGLTTEVQHGPGRGGGGGGGFRGGGGFPMPKFANVGALFLDGRDGYVELGTRSMPSFGKPITIAAWFWIPTAPVSGRKNVVGSPFLYRTTKDFLVHFGLNDIRDLPRLEEFGDLIGENIGDDLVAAINAAPEPSGEGIIEAVADDNANDDGTTFEEEISVAPDETQLESSESGEPIEE
jgi:hypothetical protein